MSDGAIPHPTRIAALEEIARDLATADPVGIDVNSEEVVCTLCGHMQAGDEPRHHERCVWLRAKGMQR